MSVYTWLDFPGTYNFYLFDAQPCPSSVAASPKEAGPMQERGLIVGVQLRSEMEM